MMLEIILHGYSQKMYSCRKIEKMVQEYLPAMWLAGMRQPDFCTINEFRHVRMNDLVAELFEKLMIKLIDEKYITFEEYFLDDINIGSNRKMEHFDEVKLREKIQETLQHIRRISEQESQK